MMSPNKIQLKNKVRKALLCVSLIVLASLTMGFTLVEYQLAIIFQKYFSDVNNIVGTAYGCSTKSMPSVGLLSIQLSPYSPWFVLFKSVKPLPEPFAKFNGLGTLECMPTMRPGLTVGCRTYLATCAKPYISDFGTQLFWPTSPTPMKVGLVRSADVPKVVDCLRSKGFCQSCGPTNTSGTVEGLSWTMDPPSGTVSSVKNPFLTFTAKASFAFTGTSLTVYRDSTCQDQSQVTAETPMNQTLSDGTASTLFVGVQPFPFSPPPSRTTIEFFYKLTSTNASMLGVACESTGLKYTYDPNAM